MAFNKVGVARDRVPVRNVIVSVFDKTGLGDIVRGLEETCPGVTLYSTGGSFEFLAKCHDPERSRLVQMSDYTGQPEMQGGLVKSLDWKIYLGILAEEGNEAHDADLARYGAVRFDMILNNLYPFANAVAAKDGAADADETVRQHIDIGGPSMLRAAAKNFLRVASVCDPGDYASLALELERDSGCLSFATRARLAGKVFRRQSEYDAGVAAWLESGPPASAYQFE